VTCNVGDAVWRPSGGTRRGLVQHDRRSILPLQSAVVGGRCAGLQGRRHVDQHAVGDPLLREWPRWPHCPVGQPPVAMTSCWTYDAQEPSVAASLAAELLSHRYPAAVYVRWPYVFIWDTYNTAACNSSGISSLALISLIVVFVGTLAKWLAGKTYSRDIFCVEGFPLQRPYWRLIYCNGLFVCMPIM